jgi:hypothetical protein
MSFEDLQAQIAYLVNQMENQPQDLHELHEQIHEKLNELKAYGMPLPKDLVDLDNKLEAYFAQNVKT